MSLRVNEVESSLEVKKFDTADIRSCWYIWKQSIIVNVELWLWLCIPLSFPHSEVKQLYVSEIQQSIQNMGFYQRIKMGQKILCHKCHAIWWQTPHKLYRERGGEEAEGAYETNIQWPINSRRPTQLTPLRATKEKSIKTRGTMGNGDRRESQSMQRMPRNITKKRIQMFSL